MNSLQVAINAAILRFVQQERPDAVEVTGFEDFLYVNGFCETCSYEEVRVHIFFNCGVQAEQETYEYRGNFADLIRELTDEHEVTT